MSAIEIQSNARELKELKVMRDEPEAENAAIEDILKPAVGEQGKMLRGEYKLTCPRFCVR